MSDYTQITDFSAKDSLSTDDPEKIILGSDVDDELAAISTAIATKYDSTDLATSGQATGETDNTVLMTPLRVANWADANAGIVGELQALADPNADRIFFWDDGEAADSNVAFLTVGTGLAITTTTLATNDAAIDHDALLNFVANEHINHASVTLTAGTGLSGGGDITANRSFALSHLGIESLVDPNADRILFWDDGAGATAWLAPTGGLEISTTNLQIADQAASSSVPVSLTSGTLGFDLSSITEITAAGIAQSADAILISDAGVLKVMPWDEIGLPVQGSQTTQTLALTDMNTIMEFTGTATLTLPLNATTALPVGVPIVLCMKHASQVVTVTAAASVTLESVNHPGGTAAASETLDAGGTAILFKTGTDHWRISGDISD